MREKKDKIGQILLTSNFINQDTLEEALFYHQTTGMSLAHYLLIRGYITEENLAECVSRQFEVPYISLNAYQIPEDIIELIPPEVVQKYWLVPLDRVRDVLTLVMINPLDEEAVSEVESLTGCKVQSFVGLTSDIIRAIHQYYNINISEDALKGPKEVPLIIKTDGYVGPERRRSLRLKAKIGINFPWQDTYCFSFTRNISPQGLLFQSDNALPVDSYIVIEINLPQKTLRAPISAVGKVMRSEPIDKGYDTAVELLKIMPKDLQAILGYARKIPKK
ncbi:MAG: PilZ domain-containing protein [Candidatus Omnitrophica bacterium]|nr:PilZ domain-containing protein [Candidatus Omnitrophota bacterium]